MLLIKAKVVNIAEKLTLTSQNKRNSSQNSIKMQYKTCKHTENQQILVKQKQHALIYTTKHHNESAGNTAHM